MPAYVIADVNVTDPKLFEDYKKLVPPSLVNFGGKFLVRGGKVHPLEGGWEPKRFVICEFPSVEQARAWWESPEYREARDLRWATAESQMIIAEGV